MEITMDYSSFEIPANPQTGLEYLLFNTEMADKNSTERGGILQYLRELI